MQCSTNLESPETFTQAKSWIEGCIEHHPSCGSLSSWYPTRLLDSGPLDLAANIEVHLRETSFPASLPTGPYMTLSYRWGLGASLTLTTETYPRLLAGVPLQDLPRAFRDAIIICRGVGVRYLWIDALCIFQDKDDLSDWHREARQMHTIYSNSFCTISAAKGESSLSSILRPRSADTLRQDELTIAWQDQGGTISTSAYYLYDEWLWIKHVVNAPVNQRAWVLQERMLSPRVLHFADTQVFWDCFKMQACENLPRGWLGRNIYTHKAAKSLPSKDHDRNKPNDKSLLRELHHQWCTLVEAYSACRLTFPTDKLIAVSAISRRFASYFQDDYFAGMWRQSLENDLLWMVNSPDPKSQESAIYIAPSWSWASTNEYVYMPGGDRVGGWPSVEGDEQFSSVEDVQLDYISDNDHFGSLKGGRLLLRGVLQRVQLLAASDLPDVGGLTMEEMELITRKKANMEIDKLIINGISIEHDPNKAKHHYSGYNIKLDRYPSKGFEKQDSDAELFCMLIYKYSFKGNAEPWSFLLLEVVNTSEGTYHRLGVIYLSLGEKMEMAALSRHGDEARFPCIQYQGGQHSIWII